jgi:hypothetical protein
MSNMARSCQRAYTGTDPQGRLEPLQYVRSTESRAEETSQ